MAGGANIDQNGFSFRIHLTKAFNLNALGPLFATCPVLRLLPLPVENDNGPPSAGCTTNSGNTHCNRGHSIAANSMRKKTETSSVRTEERSEDVDVNKSIFLIAQS